MKESINMAQGGDQLGLYISFPFCRSKCTYCNFASGVFPAHEHSRYIRCLIDEMQVRRGWSENVGAALPDRVDTIYLGGGTPSLLERGLIEDLFGAIHREFVVEPAAEVTVECAPGQLAYDTLATLVEVGVNRISIGVQSFVDREAHQSGRLHGKASVLRDLDQIRAAGIENINLDLIIGLAGQTMASWRESISALAETGVPHVSIYMFEIDGESRLGRELLAGGSRYHAGLVPSENTVVQMYDYALDAIALSGLDQYEISNFARPGFESTHNLRYWLRRPYLGLGLDAASMLFQIPNRSEPEQTGTVVRFATTDDLSAYLESAPLPETTWLSTVSQLEEAWFLGLRMNRGVSISAILEEFGSQAAARSLITVNQLVACGLVTFDGDVIRLTAHGRLLSKDVFQEFLEPDLRPGPTIEETGPEVSGLVGRPI